MSYIAGGGGDGGGVMMMDVFMVMLWCVCVYRQWLFPSTTQLKVLLNTTAPSPTALILCMHGQNQ